MLFLKCGSGYKIKFNPIHKHEFWELIRLATDKAFYNVSGEVYELSESVMTRIGDKTIKFFVEIGEDIQDNVLPPDEDIFEYSQHHDGRDKSKGKARL